MRTVDGQFTRKTSFVDRLGRDLRLLLRIIKIVLTYLVEGRRIRRAYRVKESRGEIFWVDEDAKP